MLNYYETTARLPRTNDRGIEQLVSEQYIMQAYSCSDAETKTMAFLECNAMVTAVKLSAYAEIIEGEAPQHYYDVRVAYLIPDDNGKERKEVVDYLVHDESVQAADATIRQRLSSAPVEWNICRVVETKIVDQII